MLSPKAAQPRSQGSGSPRPMSKMLLPMDEDTAMSPSPWRVTITELIMSGTDVPMARMVSPMTDCGMPMLSPKMMAIHTMKKA